MIINKHSDQVHAVYVLDSDHDNDNMFDFFYSRCTQFAGATHEGVLGTFYFSQQDWEKLNKSRSKKLLFWKLGATV